MMYMRFKDGKNKVLTLSYDDGVVQDARLIELMNRHGLKGTFNINSGMYFPEEKPREMGTHNRMRLSEAVALYVGSGQEVAVHGLTHPHLQLLSAPEMLREILEDRKGIEAQYGILARGMAYPYGTYNETVVDALDKCGICYSRTTKSTEGFGFPERWLTWHPTCHHNNPKLMALARRFVEERPHHPIPRMFYLWGHTYEFDNNDNWAVIEEFAEYMSGREEIWYATNIEIYDYVSAYNRLQVSVDGVRVYNPSAIDVWFVQKGKTYCVRGGQTLSIEEE